MQQQPFPKFGYRLFQLAVVVGLIAGILAVLGYIPVFPQMVTIVYSFVYVFFLWSYWYAGKTWPHTGQYVYHRGAFFIGIAVMTLMEAYLVWYWITVFPRKLF